MHLKNLAYAHGVDDTRPHEQGMVGVEANAGCGGATVDRQGACHNGEHARTTEKIDCKLLNASYRLNASNAGRKNAD